MPRLLSHKPLTKPYRDFTPRGGLDLLRSTWLPLQLTRSSLHCLSAILTFYALGFVALPTATAISFSAPLMVTALAPVVLGERVGLFRGSVALTSAV